MAWIWEDIQREWLAGSRVAASPAETVAAFALVEELLGRQWVESRHEHGGVRVTGSHPVAAVISMGRRLQAVRHASGIDTLLERIRAGDYAAHAELTAAYLCVPSDAPVALEFGAPAQVGNRERVPDFRLRQEDEPWVYVEVTAPDISELQHHAQILLEHLATFLTDIPLGSAAEVMVRRDPTEEEVGTIVETLRSQLQVAGPSQRDLPGLALLLVRHAEPGQIVVEDHGEPNIPRIGLARFELREGRGRHLAVRYAFSDQRAEAFLTSEARQLPRDTPGLVMVDVSRATGAFDAWQPLLARRLRPRQHTRVSSITLFSSGMWGLPEGEAWVPWTWVLENRYATNSVPVWLTGRLRSWVAPR